MQYHLKKFFGNVGTLTCVAGYQSTALLSKNCYAKEHDGLLDSKAVD